MAEGYTPRDSSDPDPCGSDPDPCGSDPDPYGPEALTRMLAEYDQQFRDQIDREDAAARQAEMTRIIDEEIASTLPPPAPRAPWVPQFYSSELNLPVCVQPQAADDCSSQDPADPGDDPGTDPRCTPDLLRLRTRAHMWAQQHCPCPCPSAPAPLDDRVECNEATEMENRGGRRMDESYQIDDDMVPMEIGEPSDWHPEPGWCPIQ